MVLKLSKSRCMLSFWSSDNVVYLQTISSRRTHEISPSSNSRSLYILGIRSHEYYFLIETLLISIVFLY